jgi:hypothetical protein
MTASPPDFDAAALQKLALQAGPDLDPARAEALLDAVAALALADLRLAALDLGTAPASGPPWGPSPDD